MPDPQQQQIPSAPVGKLTPIAGGSGSGAPAAPIGKLTPLQFNERVQPTQGGPPVPKAPVGRLTPIDSRGQAPGGSQWAFPQEQQVQPFPQWLQSGLETGYKYGVKPFEQMAQWGAEKGRQAGISAAQNVPGMVEGYDPASMSAGPEVQGAMGAAGGLVGGTATDPRQWPLMAGSFASPALKAITSAGFSGQMAYGAGSQAEELGRNWDNLSPEQKSEMITSGALQTFLAGLTGGHAYGEGMEALKPHETPIGSQSGVPEPRPDVRSQLPTSGATTARQPSPPQQTLDPYQAAMSAMRQKQNFGVEGGPKPTMEPAAQMGAGAIAAPKASMAPSETEARMQAERRIQPGQPPTGMAERRAGMADYQAAFDRSVVTGQPTEGEQLEKSMRAAKAGPTSGLQEGDVRAAIAKDPQTYAKFRELDAAANAGDRTAQKARDQMLVDAKRKMDAGPQGTPTTPVGKLTPVEQPLTQPFELPKRKPDTTAAFPPRRIGEQTPSDVDALLKSQVARGDLTKEEAARILAKRYGMEPKQPGAGFRFSSLSPEEQSRLVESTGAKQNLVKGEVGAPPQAAVTTRTASETSPQPPSGVSAQPVRQPGAEPVRGAEVDAASREALARQAEEKAAGVQRVRIDTRSGKETPLIGPEAIDAKPGPYDRIELRKPGQPTETVAEGPQARPRVAPEVPSKPSGKPQEPTSKAGTVFDMAKSDPRVLSALKTISSKIQELPKESQNTARRAALSELEQHLRAGSNPAQAGEKALQKIEAIRNQTGFLGGGLRKPPPGTKAGDVTLEAKETDKDSVADRLQEEYGKLQASKTLHQKLYDLEAQKQGDILEARTKLEGRRFQGEGLKRTGAMGGTDADHKAIYHAIEKGDNSELTEAQKKIAREEVKPILDQTKAELQKLRDLGVPTKEYENYMHRIAAKKGSVLEMALKGQRTYSPGALLSKSASSLKKASYGVAESPAGRVVVSTKGDDVYAWYKGKAEKMPTGKEDLEKSGWVFGRGTTKEITPHTGQKYFEHAGVNSTLNLLEVKRARRAAQALELYKQSPEFKEFSFKAGTGNPPAGWKLTNVDQFRGYYFEPHTAEVLNDYYKRATGGDSNAFEHLNNFLRTSIFFNPAIHVPNIAHHWFVEKGVTGFGPQAWPRVAKTSWMAIRDILTQSDRFRIGHEFGTPFQSSRNENRKFTSILQTKMLKELSENQSVARTVAEAIGTTPARLVRSLYDFSSKVTWVSQDLAFLQATYDRMYRANDPLSANFTKPKMEFDEAMREVGKHIPNYQMPSRIMNSRAIQTIMSHPSISMFGAYHYGAMKSYFEIAKELVHPDLPLKERAKALDRIGALAVSMYAMYWAQDKLREHFKDPKLSLRFPGAATIPHNIIEAAKGRKGITNAVMATVTPAPLAKIAAETIGNAPREAKLPPGEQAKKMGQRALDAVGPYSAVKRASSGPGGFDWKRLLMNMLGVYPSSPKKSSGGLPGLDTLSKLPKGPK